MKAVTNVSALMKNIIGNLKKYYRRQNSKKRMVLLVIFVMLFGLIFLHFLSDEFISKIGTLASVTIAGFVSWIQYDSKRKNVIQERQQDATERCNFVVERLKEYAKVDKFGNVNLRFFGDCAKRKKLLDGDLYIIEWEFQYTREIDFADFRIVISRISEHENPLFVDNPVSVQLRERKDVQQMGAFCYTKRDQNGSEQERVSVRLNYFSDADWEMLMYSINDIMAESRWKADPDSFDLNM